MTTDPISRYPQPPYDVTDGRLNPPPDNGEDSYVGHGRLAGRKILLTGGNSGIGRAAAIAFAREGADVVITYHSDEEGAQQALGYIRDAGVQGFVHRTDIGDESAARELVATAAEELGGLDTLVMVAGYQNNLEDVLEISTEQLERTTATNVYSVIWLVQAALEHIPAGGAIITTSSIQAELPSPDKVDYAMTKAAIVNLTKSLAQQLAPKGIRVNSVAPGPIWTELQPDAGGDDGLEQFGAKTPYGRAGQPAELAGAYVYLASDDASFTSGAVIEVTGGSPV